MSFVKTFGCALVASACFCTNAMGVVIVGKAITFREVAIPSGVSDAASAYELRISTNTLTHFFHHFTFVRESQSGRPLPSLRPYSYTLGERADWYLVGKDAHFNATTADRFTPFSALNDEFQFESSRLELRGLDDFYLGVTTPFPGVVPQLFGWAHMRFTPDGVEMLNNAVSYFDERGIIVGSTRPTPEPSSLLLTWIAMWGLFLRRRW